MKNSLRKNMISKRSDLSSEYVYSASLKIARLFLNLEEIKNAENIMLYMDFRNEVETEHIISELISMNKNVFCPLCIPKTNIMIPKKIDKNTVLKKSNLGIMEPDKNSPEIDIDKIDVIAVPGVAFDENKFRMGYGGGYYDRFIPKSSAYTVGLRFDMQILKTVPTEKHDVKLGCIVTESRIIK